MKGTFSKEVSEIYESSDVIDLHIDTFIWARIFGYDILKKHGHGLTRANFFGQVDLPRIREAKVKGGIWSITTQPFLPAKQRERHLLKNIARLKNIFLKAPNEVTVVRSFQDYQTAKAKNVHAAFLGIQGGNAIGDNLEMLSQISQDILRITLVHLSNSNIGVSSAPSLFKTKSGLTSFGKDFVKQMNANKIFIDLAHIDRKGFFDALEVHDPSQPAMVTHTGVCGVHPHWRNLDDEQIKAIAKTGGTIGIIYQSSFLGDPVFGGRAETIVRHMDHIIRIAGDDFVSLGSDWDGMITPPRDMLTCLELPKLVEIMLKLKWSEERIHKVMGGNFLRVLKQLRP